MLLAALSLAVISGRAAGTPGQGANFTAQTLDGITLELADFRGKTVVVNFWATWCPPCRAEMPGLHDYYQQHRDQNFVLLAVNTGENPNQARSFIEDTGFTFPVMVDPYSQIADQFGISGLPVTLVITPAGEISYRHTGMITLDILDAQVRPLLDG